jgi:hypothetical protein
MRVGPGQVVWWWQANSRVCTSVASQHHHRPSMVACCCLATSRCPSAAVIAEHWFTPSVCRSVGTTVLDRRPADGGVVSCVKTTPPAVGVSAGLR